MNTPLHFTKPFILVTRIGENNTNDSYLNPMQRYYEFDTMEVLFKYASRYLKHDEKALTAIRITNQDHITDEIVIADSAGEYRYDGPRSEYFYDFPTALNEYKTGLRSRVS